MTGAKTRNNRCESQMSPVFVTPVLGGWGAPAVRAGRMKFE